MTRLAWLGAAVVLVLATAGCTDGGSAGGAEGDGDDAPVAVEPPTWEVGRYWSYTGEIGDFTLVVSDDTGSDYTTDTDNEDLALFEARNDPVFLGPIAQADLSGDQGGQSVRMFQWPLVDGASWSTAWAGEQRQITAALQDDGTFRMTGTVAGITAVEYVYDPGIGWLSSMDFFHDDGTRRAGIDVTGGGSGFSGDLYRWSIEEDALNGSWAGAGAGSTNFEVGDDVTWLEYEAIMDCADATAGQHTLQMGLGDDSTGTGQLLLLEPDPPVDMAATCPDDVVEEDRLEARPGTWLVRSTAGSDGGVNTLRVDLLSRATLGL